MIQQAIILPAFMEVESIQETIQELVMIINEKSLYIVVDDSPDGRSGTAVQNVWQENGHGNLLLLSHKGKSGRGAAVYRGLQAALQLSTISKIVEMDSDGSHRAEDVQKILQNIDEESITIGSRYSPGSKIIGWPMSRRVFSIFLNYLIKKTFNLKVSDCTNGLRGYPRSAAEKLVASGHRTHSFIYLTEELLRLDMCGYKFREVSTIFSNRVLGKSTVTSREIFNSLIGIIKLFVARSKL